MNSRKTTGISVDKWNFSWSLARYGLFQKCHRAYFYQYIATTGGWDKYTDQAVRELYTLKNLQFSRQWLENILASTLRKIILESPASPKEFEKKFFSEALKKFYFEKKELELEEWRQDPKKLNLFEVYYHEVSETKKFLEELELRLLQTIKDIVNSGYLEDFIKTPYLNWKKLPFPASFHFNDVEIWLNPILLRTAKEKLEIFFLHFFHPQFSSTYLQKSSELGMMLAEQKFKIPKKNIDCQHFILSPENVELIQTPPLPDDFEAEINQSISEMYAIHPAETQVKESSFLKLPEEARENCSKCKFKAYCLDKA
jgi:hypothetical protein